MKGFIKTLTTLYTFATNKQLMFECRVLIYFASKSDLIRFTILLDVFIVQRNWVFVTNSDFPIPLSLHFNVGGLRYFKLWIILDQIMILWNITG